MVELAKQNTVEWEERIRFHHGRMSELEQTLRASSIELRFAEMKDPVKDKLKRFELFEDFGAASFHPTIGAAVDSYLEEHSVEWRP